MVNYTEQIGRSRLKALARRVLTQPQVNLAVVALAGRLPGRAEWKSRLPVVGRTATLRLRDGAEVTLLDTDRCQIAKEVYWHKGQLEKPADRLALETAIRLSRDAGLFIDTGSYTGLFALAVARSNSNLTAYAYEIVPDNFLSLWRNVLANDLVGRVSPRLVGLGAGEGSLIIPYSFGSGALASSVALDATEAGGINIPISNLDTQHADYIGRAVIKIDVETFEWPVLRGGCAFIARNHPDIICEVLRRAPNIPEMTVFLQEHRYNIFHITAAGLRPAQSIVPAAVERDWLFTRRTGEELSAAGLPLV